MVRLASIGLAALLVTNGEARGQGPQPLPPGTRLDRDLVYAIDGERALYLDLYRPAATADPLPLLIWIHGGGWQSGSKATARPALQLLGQGYAVASVEYRLSGEATFPTQIHDCKAAVRYLRAQAETLGLDPDRFVAWGSSAGGHLAALLGTSGGVAALEGKLGEHLTVGSRVQAVVNWFGPTDLAAMVTTPGYTRHARPESPESKLLGGPVLELPEQAALASPVTHVSDDDPPFIHFHGTADPVVPPQQSQLLHDALVAAGVRSELHLLDGARHGGPEFFSAAVTDLICAFLASASER